MRRIRTAVFGAIALLLIVPACPAATAGVPDRAETMMADARELMRNGDTAGALSKVRQAVEIAPNWPAAHASMGVLHQLSGSEGPAREQYTRVQLISLLRGGAQDCRLTREIAEGEALLLYLANQERTERGMYLLRPHADLAIVARGHSREMCDLNYFSHVSPKNRNQRPSDRFCNVFGWLPRCIGENLARMASRPLWSFNLDNVRESHKRLMGSDGHRKAILWDRPDHLGVGIAVNERGDYWITENFAVLQR